MTGQEGFEQCQTGQLGPGDETCRVDHATTIAVDIIVALSVLYFALTYVMLLTKLRGYRKLPYTFVQVGLVYNTLQVSILQQHNI